MLSARANKVGGQIISLMCRNDCPAADVHATAALLYSHGFGA